MARQSKNTVSVTYVPHSDEASSQHRPPGFMVYADPEELQRWRQGLNVLVFVSINLLFLDHGAVALSHVLERNQVYVTRGASKSGIHEAPSKQLLEDFFDTSDMQEIMETILEDGEVESMHKLNLTIQKTGLSYM